MINSAYNRTTNAVRKISGRIATATVVTFFLAGFLFTAIEQISGLFSLTDIGYGDSYILYDVLHFQKTGEIYRDLSLPPYLPAQYSPLVYVLYSIPGRIISSSNPFFGPRLVALAAFLLCILIVISIARSLIPGRSVWLWALLMAGSIGVMRSWVLQLRGDFPGILFDLLAIRLLFRNSRWAVVLAGLCAGFATQFKITYVTALIAGALWLLARRHWKDCARFAAAGVLSSLGIYLLLWAREHRMLHQMMALSPGVAEFPKWSILIHEALTEPVVLLALLAAVLAISTAALRADSYWGLLTLFALVAFSIAALTDIQAGGNTNYFYEALFAIVPAAVLGVRRLTAWAKWRISASLFVTLLVAFYFLQPQAWVLYYGARSLVGPDGVKARNQAFRQIEQALRGQHIFSTVPRAALLDGEPALMEPYLLSYMQRMGKFDPAPILRRLRDGEFDLVITAPTSISWRGIPHINSDLRHAIMASYQPYCVDFGYLLHLPNNRRNSSTLEGRLTAIGCTPVVCNSPFECPAW
ncbi:MAG: hypothetical protein JOY54_11935 [Acidobacteriaceae bacterium]|nr:hypothetical protein [Acidobacteriaceae bacterium]